MLLRTVNRFDGSAMGLMMRYLISVLGVSALMFPFFVVADSDDYAVVYPQVREPYAAIFRDYISGIRTEVANIEEFSINGEGRGSMEAAFQETPPLLLFALGNKSVKVVDDLKLNIPVVGAITDRDYAKYLSAGVLLTPSADVYLENLFQVYEGIPAVATVYDPGADQELISMSEEILKEKGIDFTALPSSTIREAASAYRRILSEAEPRSAIWLLSNNKYLDSSILSMILDIAWEKRLIVFASNPVFVKHGALFAIYPDNKGVGVTLGVMAKDVLSKEGGGLQPLKDVKLALNERTRNHLGIDLSPSAQKKVELMLPGQ